MFLWHTGTGKVDTFFSSFASSVMMQKMTASGHRSTPSDYLLEINKVLLAMADNELLLNSSELSGGLYEDFSTQEDTLRVGLTPTSNLLCHIIIEAIS